MKNFTLIVLLLLSGRSFAQETVEIQGQVVFKNGGGIYGVKIDLAQTKMRVVSGDCGGFKIKIPKTKQGHLTMSIESLKFDFDLKKIKDADLNKVIVLKLDTRDVEIALPTFDCSDPEGPKVFFKTKEIKNTK
jgi:hypothetical protein